MPCTRLPRMVRESLSLTSPMAQSSLVGVEPIEQIVMMEDHNEAYYAWKKAGLRDRIVVHVDAHIDFRWLPERDPAELLESPSLSELEESAQAALWNFSGRPAETLIHTGNYLNPALREGIVSAFYWVVPDGFFKTHKQRKLLEETLDTLRKTHPRGFQNMTSADRWLGAEVYGKPMAVCTLADLPEFEERVLLDIDTDFLVIDSISASYPFPDPPRATPWIWPDELVARLRERRLRTDFVTIAYSVEGGCTPLGYKHLGDDLAMLLREPSPALGHRQIMALKRQAATYQAENEIPEAIRVYQRALAVDSGDASIHCQLARLLYELGRVDDAQQHYRRAIALDPSYRTAYNNFGPVYFALGRLAHAEAEYRRASTLDPDDAYAHYGLADLCSQQGRWNEALVHYRRAGELRPGDGRARLGLGRVYAKLRSWPVAEQELRQALTSDVYAGQAHYWLGYVYGKRRRWDDALVAYKAARRLGVRGLRLHLSLGRLYLRKRNFYKAARHYGKVIRLLPAVLLISLRRLPRRTIRMLLKRSQDDQSG